MCYIEEMVYYCTKKKNCPKSHGEPIDRVETFHMCIDGKKNGKSCPNPHRYTIPGYYECCHGTDYKDLTK